MNVSIEINQHAIAVFNTVVTDLPLELVKYSQENGCNVHCTQADVHYRNFRVEFSSIECPVFIHLQVLTLCNECSATRFLTIVSYQGEEYESVTDCPHCIIGELETLLSMHGLYFDGDEVDDQPDLDDASFIKEMLKVDQPSHIDIFEITFEDANLTDDAWADNAEVVEDPMKFYHLLKAFRLQTKPQLGSLIMQINDLLSKELAANEKADHEVLLTLLRKAKDKLDVLESI